MLDVCILNIHLQIRNYVHIATIQLISKFICRSIICIVATTDAMITDNTDNDRITDPNSFIQFINHSSKLQSYAKLIKISNPRHCNNLQGDYSHKSRLTFDEKKKTPINKKYGHDCRHYLPRPNGPVIDSNKCRSFISGGGKKKRNYSEQLKFSLKFHYDTVVSNMAIFDGEIIFYNDLNN